MVYPLIISHCYEKWTIYRWFTHSTWLFPIAMFAYQRLNIYKPPLNCRLSISSCSRNLMIMTNQREIEITQFVSGCMRMKGANCWDCHVLFHSSWVDTIYKYIQYVYIYIWLWINTYSGMNIHLPAILMWTTGVQGFDTLPYMYTIRLYYNYGFLS